TRGSDEGRSLDVVMSTDGRHLAFTSEAALEPLDEVGSPGVDPDVYVHDRLAGTTVLVSRGHAGAAEVGADGPSLLPTISADGRYVAFESRASTIAPNDADPAVDGIICDRDPDADGVFDEMLPNGSRDFRYTAM